MLQNFIITLLKNFFEKFFLLDLSEHSNKKLWRAYKFNDPNQMSRDDSMLEAQMFQKCLSQKLFIAHSCVSVCDVILMFSCFIFFFSHI